MQIKFLNIYNYYDTEPCQVQYELLEFWQNAIVRDQVNFIHNARIAFTEYTFEEYDNQEKLSNEIKKSLHSGYNYLHEIQYWQWAGNFYYDFEELYNDLAKDHRLMELTITVEEE